ncbi:MAG: hypothetical protein RSC49_05375, partial [Clostridium sp.]
MLINIFDPLGMDFSSVEKILTGKKVTKVSFNMQKGEDIIYDIGVVHFNNINNGSGEGVISNNVSFNEYTESDGIGYFTLPRDCTLFEVSGTNLNRIMDEYEVYINDIRLTKEIVPVNFQKGEFNIKVIPKNKDIKSEYDVVTSNIIFKLRDKDKKVIHCVFTIEKDLNKN